MIKSKEFERVLNGLLNVAESDWDLERLEKALHEAQRKASDKRFKLRQQNFGKGE